MPREIFRDLKKAWICGHQLRISRQGDAESDEGKHGKRRSPSAPSKAKRPGKSKSPGKSKRKATKNRAKTPK
jgi:hypothetical protein